MIDISCKGKGSVSRKKIDWIGQKFNMLTIVSKSDIVVNRHYKYYCKCDCGNIVLRYPYDSR